MGDDRANLIREARTYAGNVRSRAARSPDRIAAMLEDVADLADGLLTERDELRRQLAAMEFDLWPTIQFGVTASGVASSGRTWYPRSASGSVSAAVPAPTGDNE
jgi:hypothetical protein